MSRDNKIFFSLVALAGIIALSALSITYASKDAKISNNDKYGLVWACVGFTVFGALSVYGAYKS